MDHVASLMSFLIVILVVYVSFLSPYTAEARPKLVDHGNGHPHLNGQQHHVKPPLPSTPTKAPPLPPPPPQIHNDYWPPPAQPSLADPPILPIPPTLVPNSNNGLSPGPSPAQPQSSSPPSLLQSGDGVAATPAEPPPYYPFTPEAETPDWTPPGYFPTNGIGFNCGEGPCWDSQYCNYPCAYCGSNHTCMENYDYDYDYYNGVPPVPSSAPAPQSSSPPPLSPPPLSPPCDGNSTVPPPPPPPTCAEPPCCPC